MNWLKNSIKAVCYLWMVDAFFIHCEQLQKSNILQTTFGNCFSSAVLERERIVLEHNVTAQCALYCVQDPSCNVACYNASGRTCDLTSTSYSYVESKLTTCQSCILFLKKTAENLHLSTQGKANSDNKNASWTMLFRGTAGKELPIYNLFLNGAFLLPTTEDACMSVETTSCETHYRNPVIDQWENLNIKQVKLEMYKNGNAVAFLVFGGFNGSTEGKFGWFDQKYLKNSSWKDLNRSEAANMFDAQGEQDFSTTKRFCVIKENTGCKTESGWMMVIEKTEHGKNCKYYDTERLPAFLYSAKNTYSVWSNDIAHADVLAIYAELGN